MSAYPDRPFLFSNRGNPKLRIRSHQVDLLLWKRSLGLTIKSAAASARISHSTAVALVRQLGGQADKERSTQEVRESAVSDYVSGASITTIAKKYGFGTTTVFRWVEDAGCLQSASERHAHFAAQKPRSAGHRGTKGLFHSVKSGEWVFTDSVYEFAWASRLDSDDAVLSFRRCTHRIPYSSNGRLRHYVPDFIVSYSDGRTEIHEVKPARFLSDGVVKEKAEAGRAFCASIGASYRMVLEQDIGVELIASCSQLHHSRQDDDYRALADKRRREQKRVAASRYYDKFRVRPKTPKVS